MSTEDNRGRPKLEDRKDFRKHRFNLRLNDYELKTLTDFIKKHNVKNVRDGAFVRDILMQLIQGNKVQVVEHIAPYDKKALNKIGINLNQIAKKINSLNHASARDLELYQEAMESLISLINDR